MDGQTRHQDGIEIEERYWPLLVVRFVGTPTDQQFQAYLERMTQLVGNGRKRVLLLDGRRAGRAPPSQRRMQAEWMQANKEQIRAVNLLMLIVINSAIVRGVLTAILWFQDIPGNYKVVSSLDEALELARNEVDKSGLRLPSLQGLH